MNVHPWFRTARTFRASGRRLHADRTGVALIEFAFCFPLLLLIIMGLVELANYAIVRTRLSQASLQVADNAGRLGEDSLNGPQKISERMINDVLLGGVMQGAKLDIANRGRIILSSLEVDSKNKQWIHWQRCTGSLGFPSSYGFEGDSEKGQFMKDGMGPAGSGIVAEDNRPVMFVQIAYQYRLVAIPAITRLLIPSVPFTEIASMPVRVDRDLSQVTNGEGDPVSTCGGPGLPPPPPPEKK